ncbi:MAG: hypothetical protein V3T64_02615 [Myxococcota bacterium]
MWAESLDYRTRRVHVNGGGATVREDGSFRLVVAHEDPGMLIDIDNTEDGDHVYAVWHSSAGDFGDDLLARHWCSEYAYAGLVTGAAGK